MIILGVFLILICTLITHIKLLLTIDKRLSLTSNSEKIFLFVANTGLSILHRAVMYGDRQVCAWCMLKCMMSRCDK